MKYPKEMRSYITVVPKTTQDTLVEDAERNEKYELSYGYRMYIKNITTSR